MPDSYVSICLFAKTCIEICKLLVKLEHCGVFFPSKRTIASSSKHYFLIKMFFPVSLIVEKNKSKFEVEYLPERAVSKNMFCYFIQLFG